MRQPRLVLLNIDCARTPSEAVSCSLFPPYLAAQDTYFHFHMHTIHPVFFQSLEVY